MWERERGERHEEKNWNRCSLFVRMFGVDVLRMQPTIHNIKYVGIVHTWFNLNITPWIERMSLDDCSSSLASNSIIEIDGNKGDDGQNCNGKKIYDRSYMYRENKLYLPSSNPTLSLHNDTSALHTHTCNDPLDTLCARLSLLRLHRISQLIHINYTLFIIILICPVFDAIILRHHFTDQ